MLLVLLIFLCLNLNQVFSQIRITEDKYDPVTDMIEIAGYPYEHHEVKTSDGYILKLHRIPRGKLKKVLNPPVGVNVLDRLGDNVRNVLTRKNRQPVFLMHGLLCSSADYVVAGPEKSLSYILADAGFDVWMGNARGNTFSKKHVRLDPSTPAFWNFSWHEIGIYDLPAMIDYILMKTNTSALHYVGHSQGFTTLLVMVTMKESYNNKIISVSGLSPVAYLSRMTNPFIRSVVGLVAQGEILFPQFGFYEITPSTTMNKMVTNFLCADTSLTVELCAAALFAAAGFNSDQLNRTLLPKILENTPAGASWKQLMHYGQVINSEKFQMYDYRDALKNLNKYGKSKPPEYDLSKVNIPMILFYATNDNLLDPLDAELIAHKLKKNVLEKMKIEGWNHLDFLYAIDAHKTIYSRIIKTMRKQQSISTRDDLEGQFSTDNFKTAGFTNTRFLDFSWLPFPIGNGRYSWPENRGPYRPGPYGRNERHHFYRYPHRHGSHSSSSSSSSSDSSEHRYRIQISSGHDSHERYHHNHGY